MIAVWISYDTASPPPSSLEERQRFYEICSVFAKIETKLSSLLKYLTQFRSRFKLTFRFNYVKAKRTLILLQFDKLRSETLLYRL